MLWSDPPVDRVGLATFTLEGYRHPLLAAILSAEHAIGVRHGCFCAHPLLAHLLGVPSHELDRLAAQTRAGGRPELPGAVRASFGLGTTAQDVDRLVDALAEIASRRPALGLRPRRRARRLPAGTRGARVAADAPLRAGGRQRVGAAR